jgi:hypothetical protein
MNKILLNNILNELNIIIDDMTNDYYKPLLDIINFFKK